MDFGASQVYPAPAGNPEAFDLAWVLFGLAIFGGIGFLAWHKVINEQVAAGLLGTLIGYWFDQQKGKSG